MSPILLGLVLFGVFLVLLALFARGGAGETVQPVALGRKGVANLPLPELARALRELYTARGYTVLSESLESDHADLLLRDASPLTGQTVYLRCALPGDGGAVDSLEVQATLDRTHGDQLSKAVVATPGGFTGEARLLARDANVELLDGAAIAALLEQGARPRSDLAQPQPVAP